MGVIGVALIQCDCVLIRRGGSDTRTHARTEGDGKTGEMAVCSQGEGPGAVNLSVPEGADPADARTLCFHPPDWGQHRSKTLGLCCALSRQPQEAHPRVVLLILTTPMEVGAVVPISQRRALRPGETE